MKQGKINSFLQENGVDSILWCNNPLGEGYMGGVWEYQIQSLRTILGGFLQTHNQVKLELELINFRPLTAKTIKDPTKVYPHNLLTMKANVVKPPTEEFSKPDAHSRWQHVQHITGEFCCRWRKVFLQILQDRYRKRG